MDANLSEKSGRVLRKAPIDVTFALGGGGRSPPTVFPIPLRIDECDIPEHSSLHELEHVAVQRVRPSLQSGLEHAIGRGERRGRDSAGVFNRCRKRSLAVHVLASLERGNGDLAMIRSRRGDDDGFDSRRLDHSFPVGRALRARCADGSALQRGLVDIADVLHLRRAHPAERGEDFAAP